LLFCFCFCFLLCPRAPQKACPPNLLSRLRGFIGMWKLRSYRSAD
jgi:hypothetical protein